MREGAIDVVPHPAYSTSVLSIDPLKITRMVVYAIVAVGTPGPALVVPVAVFAIVAGAAPAQLPLVVGVQL